MIVIKKKILRGFINVLILINTIIKMKNQKKIYNNKISNSLIQSMIPSKKFDQKIPSNVED